MHKIIITFCLLLAFNSQVNAQIHDLELYLIGSPRNNVKTDMPLRPSLYIHNSGGYTEASYSVTVLIENSVGEEVFNSTFQVNNANIPAGGYQRPYFEEAWTPQEDGVYLLSATVNIDGDENPSNDLMQHNIEASDLLTAFGWNAFDNIQPYGAAMLYLNPINAGEIQSLSEWGNSDTFMAGADFIGSKWYAVQYTYTNLAKIYQIDPYTGIPAFVSQTTGGFDGLAYDVTQDVVYVSDGNQLYTLNPETGETNYIGATAQAAGFVGIACSKDGDLYGMEGYAGNCYLYKINKTTGVGQPLGNGTGYSIMTAQDIAFDRNNDVLYAAFAGNQNGGFYNLNTTTGTATKIEDFGNEISGFAIPYLPLMLKTYPADGEEDILDNIPLWVMFHDQITEENLSQIIIEDDLGNQVENIFATIEGSKLTIAHSPFDLNTHYTVTIPAATLKTGDFSNEELSWSFTVGNIINVQNEHALSIHLYPNPANDWLSFKLHKADEYSIYNMHGQLVLQEKLAAGNQMINLERLSSGMYFFKLKNSNLTTKINIQ